MLKICKRCGNEKPIDYFYKHKQKKDGHLNTCIECFKSEMKENRAKNIEYYKEYDRLRANRPDRVEARRKYSETLAGKRAAGMAKARYIERNPIKRAVHTITKNAIRSGQLVKQPCEVCGASSVHAHHDDYAFPLKVRWLCAAHHAKWHKEQRSMLNGVPIEKDAQT